MKKIVIFERVERQYISVEARDEQDAVVKAIEIWRRKLFPNVIKVENE